MVLHLLSQLPDLGILAVTVIAVAGAMMLTQQFGTRALRLPESKQRDDAAYDGYKVVMSMTGVVLAFSLVQANINLRAVETTVGKEGAAFAATDRVLLRFGKPELTALRPLLASYGSSLIEDEWPLLARGQRSAAADAAYTALSQQVRAIGPDDVRQQSMYNELLRNLDNLADLREEVVTYSEYGLPKFFWITASSLLVLSIALASLMESSLSRTVAVGAPAAAVALLLAFVIITDLPFEGEISVNPSAIQKALAMNAQRN
jgi:hypothetical protein